MGLQTPDVAKIKLKPDPETAKALREVEKRINARRRIKKSS